MASNSTGLDALFQNADSDAWRDLMLRTEADAPVKQSVDPELYAVVFSTPAGREVLADMYNRYVNITRCVPGQGADAAFYREGMAQVVFDIVHNIALAQEGDGNGQER
jgi:hypothetical protein